MTEAPTKGQKIAGAPVRAGVTYAYMKEMAAAKWFALRRLGEGELKGTSYDAELKESTKSQNHPNGLSNDDIKKLSPEEKQKYATGYAEYVSKRTHVSPSPAFQSVGKLSGDPMQIIVNTLGGEGIAATNMIIRAATELSHTTNPKAGRRLVRTLLVLGVAAPVTDYAVKYLWNNARGKPVNLPGQGKDQKENDKALLDLVESFIVTYAENIPGGRSAAGTLFGPEQSSLAPPGIIGQTISDSVVFAKDLKQAMTDKSSRSKGKATMRAVQTLLGIVAQLKGVPYSSLKSMGLDPVSIWDHLNKGNQ
jgi:hypothetical protein